MVNEGIFTNKASSRLLANLPEDVSEHVFNYLYSEELRFVRDNNVAAGSEEDEDISSSIDDEAVESTLFFLSKNLNFWY